MEVLQGGRGGIYRNDDHVVRPALGCTGSVHDLLNFLHSHAFTCCPQPIDYNEKRERLSFVEGDTYNYPLTGPIASEMALVSGARILAHFHEVSAQFVQCTELSSHTWMQPSRQPVEVICHGDFTPYNVALNGEEVVGVFDFDTAHPAPKVWDLAFSIYCWAPFKTDSYDRMGNLEQQIARAKLFCDAYQATPDQRSNLVVVMMDRLAAVVEYMKSEANKGNQAFKQNLMDGHHLAYLADINYLEENKQQITKAIMINIEE
ncbi:phosphotransferase [Vibrio tapetis subsp. quintayensis]|uniref:phosphotransferase enzyme family protein n=1 Tax=Vibrio tapetis TaxID=52443 RepID=UPI0025B4B4B3|nr:phosphotransferase [Vibrio tapetis]MDN3681307.1 phosphotransferase [Vibrio tapetis subsp. quintayensis]